MVRMNAFKTNTAFNVQRLQDINKLRTNPIFRNLMREKMSTANLHSHLKSSPLLTKMVRETVEKLDEGTSLDFAEMVALARQFGSHTLNPVDGDFEMVENSPVIEEASRIGVQMGSIFKKCLLLTLGSKKDEQMKRAAELYKPQTWPCFNSQSSKFYGDYSVYKNLLSQAGANRQGVWYPVDINAQSGYIPASHANLRYNGYYSPLLLRMQMYQEMRSYLISNEIYTWLNQEENVSADLYYAINSITDVVTFANGMKYSPIELKIYVCRCKSRTLFSPASCWFSPQGNATVDNGLMRNAYVYNQSPQVLTDGVGSDITLGFKESSVHLGATPFYAPNFRNHWEVVELVKQVILPTDKFELTLFREFSKAHSIRNLEREWDTVSGGYYCEGDYSLLVTYKGLPAFMKKSGAPEGQLDLKEVDASPSQILMTSRSSISVSAPNLYTSANIPTARPANDNYISGEGRVLDTSLDTIEFNDPNWKINVVTNVSEEEGGSR